MCKCNIILLFSHNLQRILIGILIKKTSCSYLIYFNESIKNTNIHLKYNSDINNNTNQKNT